MNRQFAKHVKALQRKLEALRRMRPVRVTGLPMDMPKKGIYLLAERGRHLYVGRSNSMRRRLQQHSRPSSGHNGATFAFLLACKKFGRKSASYTESGSRGKLERSPSFRRLFLAQKERVRKMDVRYVEETNPTSQALLEIYAALALKTKYNDFDTH